MKIYAVKIGSSLKPLFAHLAAYFFAPVYECLAVLTERRKTDIHVENIKYRYRMLF